MLTVLKFLPRVWLSRFIGRLAALQRPAFLVRPVMKWFANRYHINLQEAEKEFHEYESVNALFTRKLKPGMRPIANSYFVHPADSKLTQFGVIENDTLIQAKGITYKLSEFIGSAEKAKKYESGVFIVYYLCPTDYHRVHAPVEGTVKEIKKLGLDLWPVNDASTAGIANLFIVNERVVVSMNSQLGPVEVVFVGATNVGSIKLFKKESDFVQKGEELGVFEMGSTVVMIYPKSAKIDVKAIQSGSVKVGGELKQAKNPWDN
jgi:phosphatidylserine decarboxylase